MKAAEINSQLTCPWFRHLAGVNCIPVLTSGCQG